VFCPSASHQTAALSGDQVDNDPTSSALATDTPLVDVVTQGIENSRPLVNSEDSSSPGTAEAKDDRRQEACDLRALALYGLSAGMGNGGSYLKVALQNCVLLIAPNPRLF
jgi:hypothetical protein